MLHNAHPYSDWPVRRNGGDVISQLSPVSTKKHAQALGRIKLGAGSSHVSTRRCIYLRTSADYSDDANEQRVATPNGNHSLCKPVARQSGLHGDAYGTEQLQLSFSSSVQANEMTIQRKQALQATCRERKPPALMAGHGSPSRSPAVIAGGLHPAAVFDGKPIALPSNTTAVWLQQVANSANTTSPLSNWTVRSKRSLALQSPCDAIRAQTRQLCGQELAKPVARLSAACNALSNCTSLCDARLRSRDSTQPTNSQTSPLTVAALYLHYKRATSNEDTAAHGWSQVASTHGNSLSLGGTSTSR